MSLAY